jgi:hypothetical protein
MRSNGISGYFELVRLVERFDPLSVQGCINSFQAMLPYMGAKKGVLFYGGVSPSKIGLIAPY